MKKIYSIVFTLCFLTSTFTIFSQSFKTSFEIKNYHSDTLIVGNYHGERQIVKDTLYAKSPGKFVWQSDEMPPAGMYLILLKPENNFIQFLINGQENNISLKTDAEDITKVSFKGSDENKLFYDYLKYLKDQRILADTLKAQMDRLKETGQDDSQLKEQLNGLDKAVKNRQHDIITNSPKSLTAVLLKGSAEIEVPDFHELPEEDIKMKRYYYYKQHYFDNIDFQHPALIRLPFTDQKIKYYLEKVVIQQPDSLIRSIDRVLNLLDGNDEAYRYYLADLLNKYASMKMVGYDALYVHLIDEYYKKGKAPWITEESLEKMEENAEDLRPVLIGKTFPDITTYKEDGTPVRLRLIKSPYTLVIFWAPDCGHCQKSMGHIVDFLDQYKDKGLQVLSVCTKPGEKTETCWPFTKEKHMEGFINTADQYGRYNLKVKIKSTPRLFILDENKEILIKDIPAEELPRIFEDILTIEENKKAMKK